MYQVIKHSAKGTTWGDHKYIRKEGNRYIYPEDVKKENTQTENTITENIQTENTITENIQTENTIKEFDAKEYREELKNTDDVELYRMLQRLNKLEEMNNNRPASEMDKSIKAAINIDNIRNAINVELDDRRKRNKILSEAKTAADEHRAKEEHDSRAAQAAAEKEAHLADAKKKDTLSKTDSRFKTSDALSKTDPRFKYTIKRNSDPADRYKVVRDKNDERRELAKSRANIADKVSRELYGDEEKSNKYYKDRRRAKSIDAYKDTIKGKDTFDSTNSLNNLKRGEELANKRRDIRQRNRYIDYYNVGPLRIRQDRSLDARSRTATHDPETKIKVVKKKKRR